MLNNFPRLALDFYRNETNREKKRIYTKNKLLSSKLKQKLQWNKVKTKKKTTTTNDINTYPGEQDMLQVQKVVPQLRTTYTWWCLVDWPFSYPKAPTIC